MPSPSRQPPIPAPSEAIAPVDEPERYRVAVTLEDGERVELRPIRPDDKAGLQAGLKRLSRDSVYRRFFGPKQALSERELAYLTEVDFHSHAALVATLPEGSEPCLIGVGRYVVLDEGDEAGVDVPAAELAITVDDAHQGRGIGGLLFDQLCAMATDQGIEAFVGNVMSDNHAMLGLLEAHGEVVDESWSHDGIRMTVTLADCGGGRPRSG